MSRRIEDKVEEYVARAKASADGVVLFPHRQRAEMESEIWALVPAADRRVDGKCQGRGPRLALILGGTRLDYDIRSNLLTWGSVVDVLWERVELDMTLSTAIDILRTAKKMPGELEDALLGALAHYDALPNTVALPGGKTVRKHALNRLPDRQDSGEMQNDRRARVRVIQREQRATGESSVWLRLRGELGAYVAGRLSDLDPRIGEEIYRDFERDLNLIVEEYQKKIDRTRTKGNEGQKVSRRIVIDACAVLALDPPSPGKAADLGAARRQQRRLGKLYHPDSNQGDESMRASYERVMQAYQRLDAYNAGLSGKKNGAAVVASPSEKLVEKENEHGGRGESGA